MTRNRGLFPASGTSGNPGWLWGLNLACLVPAALWLGWRLLAAFDFGYPLAYDWMSIDQHIATYAPTNRYRAGYENTSRQQRFEHFHLIARAIRHDGQGLEGLTYPGTNDQPTRLLRAAEVIHLRDVAALVSPLERTGTLCAVVWGLSVWGLVRWQPLPPRAGRVVAGVAGVALTVLAGVLIAGPTRVFYALHTAIFPPGHPWFFFYQESLMTTLMKAPDLFGFIAALWAVSGLLIASIMLPCAIALGRKQ